MYFTSTLCAVPVVAMTQLDGLLDNHAQSIALRLCRANAGNRQMTEDQLMLTCASDPLLRRAVEQIGRRKLAKDAQVQFEKISETGGLFVASHPS